MPLFQTLVKRGPLSDYIDCVPCCYPVMQYPVESVDANGDKTVVYRDENRLSDDGLNYDFYTSENCVKLGINPLGSLIGSDSLAAAEAAEDALNSLSNSNN